MIACIIKKVKYNSLLTVATNSGRSSSANISLSLVVVVVV
jgi:hypothetical protein